MDYDKLVYKLGSLHSLLRELQDEGLYQGEHSFTYRGADGTEQTIHVYIDGTDLQMSNIPGNVGLNLSINTFTGTD
jgi:VCBS repeat-containing protein